VSREMLCPPNVFKLETVLHFEKEFKKRGFEGFHRKADTFLEMIFMGAQFFFQI